ncbi:cytochrome P450 [Cynara cardunculus var. scolymus]|uniref:Cytochrome P450 n=1 Tax=Cynara cardunculus var. scolymus TaxID=59895 RepID=A0A103Y4Z4_CYNCS|nr:cytochrome P450 [Cynara cardunculus var. scolymus]
MAVLTVVIGVVLGLCLLSTFLLRWNEMKYKKKGLPPGTMGWPLFGETTDFLKQGPSFMKNQRARYGSVFKSHILGCPTIVSMDPELNRYILMNESKGILPGYPQSMLDILGKSNIAAVHGPAHKNMRGALLSLVSPTIIKDKILPKIDDFMRSHLSNWSHQVIDIQEKTKEMALLSSLKQISGIESCSLSKEFMPEFCKLVLGTLSLPINLPNTSYHRGLQARKNIVRMLGELIDERRKSQETHEDMLSLLMSGKEHLGIRVRKMAEDPLDWDDYKSMKFTRAVIFETSRLATIVNGVLRKTTKEMELNGFVIPEGWRIYVYTREINYDPCLYPDPYTFNPWRWLDRNLETQNYFFIFGGGTRQCPGKELGIAEISTFLHYFVTRYRWEEVGGDELMKFPRVEAPNGFHIRVSNLNK